MKVNTNQKQMADTAELTRDTLDVPVTISTRTDELRPLLQKWREDNRGVPWAYLLNAGLKHALKPYAGKRYAHLVEPKNGEVAA